MTYLSAHFTLDELVASITADKLHINNTPNAAIRNNLTKLCVDILEPLRNHVGHAIIINSGYRCPQLNRAVGGVANSYHCKGMAADIMLTSNMQGRAMGAYLLGLPHCDLVILEITSASRWLHVQWSDRPRHRYREISQ